MATIPTTSSARPSGLRDSAHGHERDDEPGDGERHVDPEDRRPAEDRQEGSSDHRSEPEAETRDGSPHAERARPALDRVGLGQDGQRQGRHERTARTLQGAGTDERHVGGGQGARHRAQREDDHADQEEPLPPVAVPQGATEGDEGGEAEGVRADHPLELARRHVQLALNGRQRGIHDGDVEQGHALRDAHRHQGQAAPARHPRVLAGGRADQTSAARRDSRATLESCVNLPGTPVHPNARRRPHLRLRTRRRVRRVQPWEKRCGGSATVHPSMASPQCGSAKSSAAGRPSPRNRPAAGRVFDKRVRRQHHGTEGVRRPLVLGEGLPFGVDDAGPVRPVRQPQVLPGREEVQGRVRPCRARRASARIPPSRLPSPSRPSRRSAPPDPP